MTKPCPNCKKGHPAQTINARKGLWQFVDLKYEQTKRCIHCGGELVSDQTEQGQKSADTIFKSAV